MTASRSFPIPPWNRPAIATRSLAQRDLQAQRVGAWDPTSSFRQTASGSLVRGASARGVLPQKGVSPPRLTTRHFMESGVARPHGSVSICEAKKDSGWDEPARSVRRPHPVIVGRPAELARLSCSRTIPLPSSSLKTPANDKPAVVDDRRRAGLPPNGRLRSREPCGCVVLVDEHESSTRVTVAPPVARRHLWIRAHHGIVPILLASVLRPFRGCSRSRPWT
jgi:hypothetical protein